MRHPAIVRRRVGIALLCLLCVRITAPSFADGLPGEYLVNNRWRDLLSRYSPLTNAAFLSEEDKLTVRGAFALTMQGAFQLWESGVVLPLNSIHSAGISLLGQNDGNIEGSTFDDASNTIISTGVRTGNSNLFALGSYAFSPLPHVSIGVNVSFAYQSNFGAPLKGFGLDMGCAYRIMQHPVRGEHTVGLSTVNLVKPSMTSSLSPDLGNPGQYSSDLRISWMGDFLEKQLEAGADLDLRDLLARKHEFDPTRSSRSIEWGLSTRAGYWIKRTLGIFAQSGFDNRLLEYWGVAGGVRIPLKEGAPETGILYNYTLKTEGDRASTHTWYLLMRFGQKSFPLRDPADLQKLSEEQETPSSQARSLRRIPGIRIEEEREYVRITAEEVAVHFASGSADLPQDAIPALREIAAFVRTYPNHPVVIEGHTDNDPITGKLKEKFPDNNALSKARCEAVKDYFVSQEMLPEKLFTTRGYGESKPIAANTTAQEKYKNRRVVVIIQKN